MKTLLLEIISGLILTSTATAAPALSATVRAERCDGGSGAVQALNGPYNNDVTELLHAGLTVAHQATLPPGEDNPGNHCTTIADPGYSLPGGNVSAWFPNNTQHLVTCADVYDGVKIIVRGDTSSIAQRYEVYSVGGAWLYETVRGPWFYPNGYRSNTIRYSTTRCVSN